MLFALYTNAYQCLYFWRWEFVQIPNDLTHTILYIFCEEWVSVFRFRVRGNQSFEFLRIFHLVKYLRFFTKHTNTYV